MLIVNGYDEIPLKSIRPFTRELEYDYIQEGGINDYVHILRKPSTKPFTIQVERYAIPKTEDPISEGTVYQVPMQLVVGENHGRKFERKRTYILMWPRILNKEIGAMDAERSGLLTETVTIAYSHMVLIHADTDNNGYKFEKGKTKPAYGLGAYLDVPANKESRDDFIKKAEGEEPWKWDSEGSWRGEGKRKAATNRTEPRKGVMKRNAKTFEFGQADAGDDKSDFTAKAKEFTYGTNTENPALPDMSVKAKKYEFGTNVPNEKGAMTAKAKTFTYGAGKGDDKTAFEAKAKEFTYGEGKDGSAQEEMTSKAKKYAFGTDVPNEKGAMTAKAKTFTYGTGKGDDKTAFEAKAKEFAYGTDAENPAQPGMSAKAQKYEFGTNVPNEKGAMTANAKTFTYGTGKGGDKTAFTARAKAFSFGSRSSNEKAKFLSKSKKYSFGKKGDKGKNRKTNKYNDKNKKHFESKAKLYKYGSGGDKKDQQAFESKARLWPEKSSARTVEDFLKS